MANPKDASVSSDRELRALILLLVSFFSGRSLKESAELRIFDTKTQNQHADIAIFFADDAMNDQWRFPALRPPYRTLDESIDREAFISLDYIWLPLPWVLGRLLRKLIGTSMKIEPSQGLMPAKKVFFWSKTLSRAVRETLRQLDPSGRLTPARIQATLPGRLITKTRGDVALASMALGREHALAGVEIYYDGMQCSDAAGIYSELMHEIERVCLPDFVPASHSSEVSVLAAMSGADTRPSPKH